MTSSRNEGDLDQASLDLFIAGDESRSASRTDETEPRSPKEVAPDSSDPLRDISRLEELAAVAVECRRCHLRETCNAVVFGEGNPEANLVFVGEAPGADEDRLGRPFVGRAGKLLDKIITASGLARQDVYITNIVKCRPPGNRTPDEGERNFCIPYLHAQMRIIQPEVIVSLGAAATQGLIDPRARITRMRGTWQQWRGIDVMPTFHPAALLRDPKKKIPVWEDMKTILGHLGLSDGEEPG